MNIIEVTVIYVLPHIQYVKKVKAKSGSTVRDVILKSNLLNKIKNISLYKNRVGIYNKLVNLTFKVKDGDRVEIYRNLLVDPKERRRIKYFSLQNSKF